MAGFLSGLRSLLLGGDPVLADERKPAFAGVGYEDDPNTPGLMRSPMITPGPDLKQVGKSQGLLSKLGSYVTSPEGMLAIGTTLRAGNSDPNAFSDQQAILKRRDEGRKEAETKTAMLARNKRFRDALKTDPATGKTYFDQAAFAGAPADDTGLTDFTDDMKTASELGTKVVPVGKHVAKINPINGDVEWLPDLPLTPEEEEEAQSRRDLRQAQIEYYGARAEAVPQDVETRRYRAEHPGSGGGRGGGAKGGMTPAQRAAFIAAVISKGGSVN